MEHFIAFVIIFGSFGWGLAGVYTLLQNPNHIADKPDDEILGELFRLGPMVWGIFIIILVKTWRKPGEKK